MRDSQSTHQSNTRNKYRGCQARMKPNMKQRPSPTTTPPLPPPASPPSTTWQRQQQETTNLVVNVLGIVAWDAVVSSEKGHFQVFNLVARERWKYRGADRAEHLYKMSRENNQGRYHDRIVPIVHDHTSCTWVGRQKAQSALKSSSGLWTRRVLQHRNMQLEIATLSPSRGHVKRKGVCENHTSTLSTGTLVYIHRWHDFPRMDSNLFPPEWIFSYPEFLPLPSLEYGHGQDLWEGRVAFIHYFQVDLQIMATMDTGRKFNVTNVAMTHDHAVL